MIWVAWRRQRTELLITLSVLVLLGAVLVPTGLSIAHAYDRDGIGACLGKNANGACDQAIGAFTSQFDSLSSLIAWMTLVPGVIGVLLAVPFVLEFEQGTHRLAWTQSVSRRRWLAVKLGIPVAVALVTSLVFTLLVTWWRAPLVRVSGRMDSSVFDSEGIVVFGYTLFALGLATVIGVIWRRGVPAVVVGFLGYFAARLFVDTWLRQQLLPPLTRTWRLLAAEPSSLRNATIINEYPSDRFGNHVRIPFDVCAPSGSVQKGTAALGDCLGRHGYFTHAVYQPASHFWPLQLIETSLFGGVAIVLLVTAALWAYRRAA
jgi:ABC-type transport system involved in multi-copper enzyme maturation permease subunit